jgi:hypothetical protein
MSKGYAKRTSQVARHKVGNRYLSDYDLGWDLWYARRPLPLGASRNTQQGYVNGAKCKDKCLVVSMKHACRQGRFVFLSRFAHLAPDSGRPLSCGAESRLDVRIARASVAQVKRSLPLVGDAAEVVQRG